MQSTIIRVPEEVVGGGVDRECRGADWDDDSPGYYSVAHAHSLARCQDPMNSIITAFLVFLQYL